MSFFGNARGGMSTEDFLREVVFGEKKKRLYRPEELPDAPMSTEDFLRKLVFGEEMEDQSRKPNNQDRGTVQRQRSSVQSAPIHNDTGRNVPSELAAAVKMTRTDKNHAQDGEVKPTTTHPGHMIFSDNVKPDLMKAQDKMSKIITEGRRSSLDQQEMKNEIEMLRMRVQSKNDPEEKKLFYDLIQEYSRAFSPQKR